MTKTPIEPGDIRKGDLIRREYGDVDHVSNAAVEYYAACDGFYVGGTLDSYFLLDRPKPPVVLPTEVGVYFDKAGDIWVIGLSGKMAVATSGGHDWLIPWETSEGSNIVPENYAPFTKLEPVAETAAKMLALAVKAIEESTPASTSYKTVHARAVKHAFRAEFGVTP